jgi:hypothetical protein
MSLFVPLEHGVQVELVWSLAGLALSNRLWFVVVDNDPTTTDLSNIGNGVATWCADELAPILSQDITFEGVRAYDATVAYPGPQVTIPVGVSGGVSDFQTFRPPALWLNWNFVSGIPKSAVNLNTIEPSFKDAIKEAYDVLLDVFSLFVYRWEATSAVVDGVPLTTRNHYRIDHIRVRRDTVSQRRLRLTNPAI